MKSKKINKIKKRRSGLNKTLKNKKKYIVEDSTTKLSKAGDVEIVTDVFQVLDSEAYVLDSIDNSLFEKSKTQWQFGDWLRLKELSLEELKHHPDRAVLSLLAAAGHLQAGDLLVGRHYLSLSLDWGCKKSLVTEVLVSGVHNSLGRMAVLAGNFSLAQKHFSNSLLSCEWSAEPSLLTKARVREQCLQLGVRNHISASLFDDYNVERRIWNDLTKSRLIVVNGMVRSGSTVIMNIVTDILEVSGIPYVKYYIDDLKGAEKLGDHILQNKNLMFVIKTHIVNKYISDVVEECSGKYIYSKRNLYEVAASYLRMTENRESPFYKETKVTLNELIVYLSRQVKEYKKSMMLSDCLTLDCVSLSNGALDESILKISKFMGICLPEEVVNEIKTERSQYNSALIAREIEANKTTSLHHDSTSFFHKDHVIYGGTKVSEYLPSEWKQELYRNFSDVIDRNGDFSL